MNTGRTKILGGIVIVLIVLVGGFLVFSKPKDPAVLINKDIVGTKIPSGWYSHRMNTYSTLLTKQEKLPNITAPEGWAYGEQIDIDTMTMDKPMEQWLIQAGVEDEATTSSKTWGTLNGQKLLRFEQEVGAAGKTLNYFLFNGNQVQVFTLFPLEPRNAANINALEQVVSYYAK